MMKVKVSEEVAKLLNEIDKNYNLGDYRYKTFRCLELIGNKGVKGDLYLGLFIDFFDDNDISIADIENCFKLGWELDYEFQVGDVVKNRDVLFIVTEEDLFENTIFQHNKKHYTLICKAEDRKDLKQC